jgi:hypothetical protein
MQKLLWLNRYMQPQQPEYRPQPHQPVGTPSHRTVENYTAPKFEDSQESSQPDFSFITDPATPFTKPSPFGALSLNGTSMAARVGVIAGALIVLLMLFVIIRNMLSGSAGFNTATLMSVAEDQQELVHLTTTLTQNAQGRSALNSTTLNSAITIQLTAAAAQTKVIHYLQTNHYTVNAKLLPLKINTSLDTELANAIAGGTIDTTYQSVVQTQLNTYCNDLRAAYDSNKGVNGRTLLSNDYDGAQLLLQQLKTPAS